MNAEALIGTVLGTCTLQKLLGQGGMGAVYLAQQSRPRRQVAVKVLLPMTPLSPNQLAAFLERFRRETDAAASLEHPNIMPVHEYGEREGLAYLVMPYISGGTLRDQLERERQLPLDKTMNYLDQMVAAIDMAHEHGVIHRDIKPANILMTPEGRLLLTDFGLVKIIAEGQIPQLRLTGPGAPVGTPDYMAPEQVIGEEVDTRADLYSLGIILYQMVAGTTPFQGDTPMQIAAQHLQLPPPPPRKFRPDLPAAAEQVILRALEKRAGDRYARAQDLAIAFRMALVASGMLLETNTVTSMPRIPINTGRMFTANEALDASTQTSLADFRREETGADNSMLFKTGLFPSVTSNLPAARGGGLLSRTGMMPALAKQGALTPPDTASMHGGGLLSRTGKFPQVGVNSGMHPAARPAGPARPAAASSLLAATEPKFTVPLADSAEVASPGGQQDAAGTVKLTGPVKVVQVPVAGQPGKFVTGLLPVAPAEEAPASANVAKSEGKKPIKPWAKGVAIALLVALIVGGISAVVLTTHHSKTHPRAGSSAAGMAGAQPVALNGATATAQANIIVSDPLSEQINNWLTSPADTFAFKDGAYHITDRGDHGRASILQGHTFDNSPMIYSLTMQEINGNDNAENNTFGMIFRFTTKMVGNRQVTTFYSFEVENTPGGYYRLWKYDDSNAASANAWTDLWHAQFGKEFHQGHGAQAVNTFKVAMNGAAFTFTVNGKVVGSTKNAALTGGMMGMTVNLNGTEVAFKDLLITHK